jgi:hypothetical protein
VSDYTHLDSRHRALADLAADDRIQWIRAERGISHPAAETALEAMEDLLSYPSVIARRASLCMAGPARELRFEWSAYSSAWRWR